jgi:hypothetical protein
MMLECIAAVSRKLNVALILSELENWRRGWDLKSPPLCA